MQCRGFQMMELTLVCALISLTATWGIGHLQEIREQQRLETACQSFLTRVSSARTLAVTRNLPIQVRIHPDRKRYSMSSVDEEPVDWIQLPRGVRFSQFPRLPVTFRSRGTATPAGSFTIASYRGEVQVIVAVSGRIRWRRL